MRRTYIIDFEFSDGTPKPEREKIIADVMAKARINQYNHTKLGAIRLVELDCTSIHGKSVYTRRWD